jgi:hypothetical protein
VLTQREQKMGRKINGAGLEEAGGPRQFSGYFYVCFDVKYRVLI